MKNRLRDQNHIGDKLKMFRAQKGLSQTQLSQLSKINIAQISRYENDQAVPNVDIIEKLSAALGIDYLELAGTAKFNTVEYDKTLKDSKSLPETDKLIIKEVVDKFLYSYKINKAILEK